MIYALFIIPTQQRRERKERKKRETKKKR